MMRLIQKRKMSGEDAWERIHSQSDQKIKLDAADVIINNEKTFEETWKQVAAAWQLTVPAQPAPPPVRVKTKTVELGEVDVRRARPQEAKDIAKFITQITKGERQLTSEDIMAAFGEKAFLFLSRGDKIVGLIGWQVENLVARVDDVYLEANLPLVESMKALTTQVEKASKELQCEAALLFLPPQLAQHTQVWKTLEYTARAVKDLGVRAWQEAAMESMPPGTVMLFKQLRVDRVLRPV